MVCWQTGAILVNHLSHLSFLYMHMAAALPSDGIAETPVQASMTISAMRRMTVIDERGGLGCSRMKDMLVRIGYRDGKF